MYNVLKQNSKKFSISLEYVYFYKFLFEKVFCAHFLKNYDLSDENR